MTIQEIYDFALQLAIKADPRGESFVKKSLAKVKKEFDSMSAKQKRFFDTETLTNPYSDTRIYVGDPKTKVKKILCGIDITVGEVMLFDRLNEKGMKFDLLMSHHPEGRALTQLHETMEVQTDAYADAGVPVNVASELMHTRMGDVERKIHPNNYNQVIDAAKLLGVPFMNCHTFSDNLANKFMVDFINGKDYFTVGEIVDDMMEIPEYIQAAKDGAGPLIVSGSEKSRAGKIAVFFTGGTNPSKEIYVELAKSGVGTIIDMHMPEDAIKEMKKHHVNVINAGHMSSDSIGLNMVFDELEKKGVEIVACGGFIRVSRNGKGKK